MCGKSGAVAGEGTNGTRGTKTVRDVVAPVPLTIAASASINHAARLMRAWDVAEILVTERGRFVGVLTATEVVVRAIAAEAPPSSITARDACDGTHPRLSDDQPVAEALDQMRELGVQRLPVVGRRGRLVGSVWITDLEAAVAAPPSPAPATRQPAAPGPQLAPAWPARQTRIRRNRAARTPHETPARPGRTITWPPTRDRSVSSGH